MQRPCIALAAFMLVALASEAAPPAGGYSVQSVQTRYYSMVIDSTQAGVLSFSVDSLGRGEFRPNLLMAEPGVAIVPADSTERIPKVIGRPGWRFRFERRGFRLESRFQAGAAGEDIVLRFDPQRSHATLLGINDRGQVSLPALLHLPEYGSLRIEAAATRAVKLGYDAHRKGLGFVAITLPAATAANPSIVYSLEVTAIYPHLAGIDDDPRFDGFRRDYLNALQVQAHYGVLANHAASDPCAFVMYMYSEIARYAPHLADGLSAMDLVRMSLDKYLAGFIGYGLPGFQMFDDETGEPSDSKVTFLDTYPSLLIAASDYVTATHNTEWLRANYPGLRRWTEAMLATDTNGDGLLKYAASGNSGSWKRRSNGKVDMRPSNWWDTIGFGYEDAYSNALAYHALQGMQTLADMNAQPEDANRYRLRAAKLRDAYLPAFLNPKTGVLAGWRSEDGKLHDYYFLFVNGAAVVYGLVSKQTGNAIYDRLLDKMRQVGYTRFELGLPGNLIPIRKEDYVDSDPRWGGPSREDGSDGFQTYENGGATASFSYFTIAALYKLGRVEDGDRLLFPMLMSFKNGAFEGRDANGMTNDWKTWNGSPNGYEGFLADNFMAFAAVMDRPGTLTDKERH